MRAKKGRAPARPLPFVFCDPPLFTSTQRPTKHFLKYLYFFPTIVFYLVHFFYYQRFLNPMHFFKPHSLFYRTHFYFSSTFSYTLFVFFLNRSFLHPHFLTSSPFLHPTFLLNAIPRARNGRFLFYLDFFTFCLPGDIYNATLVPKEKKDCSFHSVSLFPW